MMEAQLRSVVVDRLRVTFRAAGEGPPIVLLHGFLCDSRVWRTQLAGLADAFRLIAWDSPGAGGSDDPAANFTIADWAAALGAFLDRLGISEASIVGLSWGGLLAQELYRVRTRLVRRLVLADTYAGWRGSFDAAVAAQRLARCERESFLPPDGFVPLWVPHEFFTPNAPTELVEEMRKVVSTFHPRGFRLMARSLAESDMNDLLPRIQVPTLLLWGADDLRSPIPVAERFVDAIPNAELKVIPRAGHVSNMEQPEMFNEHLRRFCGS
jgi:pimeloyl-ACP methyl ester carboxylesterase